MTLMAAATASAKMLPVGPGATYSTIAAAMVDARPGDVVTVQGGQTYHGIIKFNPNQGGTPGNPITVRGIPVNGQRPILTGIGTAQWDTMVVLLNANHFVMESFEVVGDSNTDHQCVVNKADDVVLRDFVIHDCQSIGGLFATDTESGSLTIEYSELYRNGSGQGSHQIYMASDSETYPGSVFRMQFCYVHDGLGGNNVKSRAQRNEIYYNWIEGATYHELDLIGADGAAMGLAREDSDVVGNVLVKTSSYQIARIGGDGTGDSAGRFRFVNNTMILAESTSPAIALQYTVESLEMYNNVIYGAAGGAIRVYRVYDLTGASAVHFGSNNWLPSGSTSVPTSWTATTMGTNPGWVNASALDVRPAGGSPLIGAGTTTTSAGAAGIPSPLSRAALVAPMRQLLAVGTAQARTFTGAPSIGAYEPATPSAGSGGTSGTGGAGGSGGSGAGGGTGGSSGTAGTSGGAGGNGGRGGTSGNGGTGGRGGSGGVTATGGATGSGGSTGAGGVMGAGGTSGRGGTGGRGGISGGGGQAGQTGAAGATGGGGGSADAGNSGAAGETGVAGRAGTAGTIGAGGIVGSNDGAAGGPLTDGGTPGRGGATGVDGAPGPGSDGGGCSSCSYASSGAPGGLESAGLFLGAVALAWARRRRRGR